ncbi:MAG TPA: ABC transporter permease [Acidimicrobiales bacterium]|nr:ABC transporter permease [Acidimicrobiales bacterium]
MPLADLSRRVVGRLPGTAAIVTSAVVWVALLGPLIVLLFQVSPHAIRTNLDQPGAFDPLWTSLQASATALGLMLVLGTPLAYLLARGRVRFARVVEAGIVLPLLMPPLVIGLLLIFLIGQAGPVGRFVSGINPNVFGVNTMFALVVAEFFEAAPYYIISAAAALTTVDQRLEQDALLLGDRPLGAFRRITLPLAAPGLATGIAISWARAMGAFGAVLIIAYNPAGLPIDIDQTFIANGLTPALVVALLLIVAALPLPLIALLWSARARGRRMVPVPVTVGP